MPNERVQRIDLPEPAEDQLLESFVALAGELNRSLREEDLVKRFVDAFELLLPGRLIAVRLLDPEQLELKLVYARGLLREERRDRLQVAEQTLADCELENAERARLIREGRISIAATYDPIFVDGASGFELVLGDRKNLLGLLNVEYPSAHEPHADRAALAALAALLSSSLCNARLLNETVFLKDYLEKLLDRANAPVLVLDRQGRITVVNRALERQTGYDRSDLLGDEFMSLVPDPERARLLPAVINAMRGEPTSNIEVRIPKADDSGVAHIAFNTATILSAFGEVEGVIFIGQDLTEVRELQRQIIHSEKLATLGQVAAGVAHELNNPLTSITVYANYLSKVLTDTISEQDYAKLQRIVEAAERIQSFTKDLVTYARPSGEEPTLINVTDLLERALSFCEHLIGDHGADVTLDVSRDVRPVYGIRGQLEQVFVNLLTNACHALPHQGGKIVIAARPINDEQIAISVADTGSGIHAEHIGSVFEPFFTTKDQGEGTGLGLSIIRNILENHNAEIKVESELGQGTTFTITLYVE